MINIDLGSIGNGGLQERFNREMEKVVKNMKDPNTPYKDVRKVTITLTMKQNEERTAVQCSCEVSSKLAKARTFDTSFGIGKNHETGEYLMKEYGSQIPGQLDMGDVMPAAGGDGTEKVKDFKKLKPAMGGM